VYSRRGSGPKPWRKLSVEIVPLTIWSGCRSIVENRKELDELSYAPMHALLHTLPSCNGTTAVMTAGSQIAQHCMQIFLFLALDLMPHTAANFPFSYNPPSLVHNFSNSSNADGGLASGSGPEPTRLGLLGRTATPGVRSVQAACLKLSPGFHPLCCRRDGSDAQRHCDHRRQESSGARGLSFPILSPSLGLGAHIGEECACRIVAKIVA
jgi:hypothetical protein